LKTKSVQKSKRAGKTDLDWLFKKAKIKFITSV
jgi:hypothetical protein